VCADDRLLESRTLREQWQIRGEPGPPQNVRRMFFASREKQIFMTNGPTPQVMQMQTNIQPQEASPGAHDQGRGPAPGPR